ncbi:metal ABC transporter ATP-binding protein [Pseudomonas benzenivorans]|uniref:ABC transporter ATP-binding protein n=1 Tax=Pseudomonas benzenivorans TaxID=556533 RepID=A0ABY5H442_9PSED|nr:ABC transporter ATP-binding protein [Pseudomonas benzenivorans]UTW05826.1 ABC transporter ATP-binding protein [Pseudomonas benzenivorans]
MNQALRVENLSVSYAGHPAVQNASLCIEEGLLVGIVGPNGAGKSTLLKALLELIPSDHGRVEIFGRPLRHARRNVAYVPQRSEIDWQFPISVLDTVVLGTYPNLGWFNKPGRQERQRALECLRRVGMQDFALRQIGELSGGQQQRVFLARALVQHADLYLLDEPFVGIDALSERTIIGILKSLRDAGKTVLVVHHDLSKATEYFDRLVLINQRILDYGDAAEVCRPDILAKAYLGGMPWQGQAAGAC